MAIVGSAERMAPAIDDSLETMIFSTAHDALQDAEMERDDVEGIATACSDQVDGRAISSMLTMGAAGGHLRDEVNVASSGAHALVAGYLSVASGRHDTVLVSTWGKASEGNVPLAEHLSTDPYFDRDLPLTDAAAMAMQAAALRREVPDAAEAAAAVVEKNRRETVSKVDVETSPLVAVPLRELEIPPPRDGACSFVLTSASVAARYRHPVWIEGIAWAADQYRLSDRDLVGLPHLRGATQIALSRAGRRVDELDFIEAHDYCADAEVLAYAGLGLCGLDGATAFVLGGSSSPEGAHPVNLSGGSLSGEVPFVGALARLGDLLKRLRSSTAIHNSRVWSGLLQMASGFAGQFQTVAVFSAGAAK